jgi:hypothetical protein
MEDGKEEPLTPEDLVVNSLVDQLLPKLAAIGATDEAVWRIKELMAVSLDEGYRKAETNGRQDSYESTAVHRDRITGALANEIPAILMDLYTGAELTQEIENGLTSAFYAGQTLYLQEAR